jgi:hypothetical protein
MALHPTPGEPVAWRRRRAERLLAVLAAVPVPPGRLRELRSVEALERMGTPAARGLLARLAAGDPAAYLTREARAARDRFLQK